MRAIFDHTVVEGTIAMKKTLDDVVGLSSKSAEELCQHVIHVVEKYRGKKSRNSEQEREHLINVAQL